MIYSEVIQVLANNIINFFDQVYYDAEIIVNDKGIKQPAITLNDEWVSLVPTDQREIIYIRRSGDDDVIDDLKIGSCKNGYKMRSPLRIVFFKDNTTNHEEILRKLMQSVLIGGTKLRSITRDKWRLQKDESSGDYNFGATTAYFALDIYAMWDLMPNTCDEDCTEIQNPLRRCVIESG